MKGTNKGKRLSMLAAGALIIGMALTAGLVGCDNGAVDATITGYGLPGAAEPAELTIRHSELTAGYDFGSKSGTLVLNVGTTTVQMDTNGNAITDTTGYSTTGTFTDSFGVQYAVSGGFSNTGSTGYGTFYGTIGGKNVDTGSSYGKYISGTVSSVTGGGYTITETYASANVLEPVASLYVVSYKKAAVDASHNFVFRFVGKNTVSNSTSTLQSAGFGVATVSGYPVTNALVVDNAAGDKAKAYDPDLVTYILSVNDFLNGTAAGVPDAFETKEFQFGFQNTQVNHDPSYTWIEQTVRRAAQ